jgi:micrococcal nuclease
MRHSPDFHRQIRALERGRRVRRRSSGFGVALVGAIAVGAAIGAGWSRPGPSAAPSESRPLFETVDPWAESRRSAELLAGQENAPARIAQPRFAAAGSRAPFGFCHSGGGLNCVVDGDTFWMDGERIRIADIDAPETHPSRCADEARLGGAATERLQALLNQGEVTLEIADRDTDRYGRKLRIVTRGGRSLGAQLVDEGLARSWSGRRRPWC